MSRACSAVSVTCSRYTSPRARSTRPRIVSVSELACSKISFCMKCLYSPLAAEIGSQGMLCSFGCEGPAVQGGESRAVLGDHGHLAAFQKDHPPGVFEDGRHVGCDEHLALAVANSDTAGIAQTRGDQHVRAHDAKARRSR